MNRNKRIRPRRRNGLLALSPMLVMAACFVVLSFVCGGFSQVPILIVFLLVAAYALLTLRGWSVEERLRVFSRGAGQADLLLMVWIFVLAGGFAATAKAMGAIDATVGLCLSVLPPRLLLPGMFTAACLVSLSVGTSVGTIVALVPLAAGLAEGSGLGVPLLTGAIVGGAFFGDNLSFISDTTVAATRTQGCRMSDKFRANLRIALPAALVTAALYAFLGGAGGSAGVERGEAWRVLPYVFVLAAAAMGLHVVPVLGLGIVVAATIGFAVRAFDAVGLFAAIVEGIGGMGELILVSLIAGGLLELVRQGGGITWLIRMLTKRVRSPRGGQAVIVLLTMLTNLCTANNTVAILSVGPIARDVAARFGISPVRTASLLDTSSCIAQGLLPYGAQLLMAGALAGLAPTAIIPYLFYPVLLAVAVAVYIIAWPRALRTAN